MARTMEKLEDAVKTASAKLGYMSLKQKQLEVVTAFLSGRDVFAALPTGYGKSLCYGCLPLAHDKLLATQGSVMLEVSPLIALMKDEGSSPVVQKEGCLCSMFLLMVIQNVRT